MELKAPESSALLNTLTPAIALFQKPDIVLDIFVGGIFASGGCKRRVRAFVIPAQHIGKTLVVQDLDRWPEDANRLTVGTVGKIETP
jgi:hypothetical protein